jgi:hypothetical protein
MGSLSTPPAHPGQATHEPGTSRWQRIQPPVLVAAVVLGTGLALHLRDPHQQGSWGFCPWLLLTGTYCPGCGGLRGVNDLTNGDVLAAAGSNLLLVAAVPAALALWVRSVLQRWRGARRPWPPTRVNAAWALGSGAVLLFWVLRNLPVDALHWLRP